MTAFLRRWPFWVEFGFVVAVAFGYFIVTSIAAAFHPERLLQPHHNNLSLLILAGAEALILAGVGAVLWARGWSLRRIGLAPSSRETASGLALGVATYLAYAVAFIVFAVLFPALARQARDVVVIAPGISLATAIVVPWINALFEETLVAGYVITALRERVGVAAAVNVSVAIRLAYHLYQGALGVVGIVPLGLIFAYWYVRTGRLWPLAVAHAAIDMIGFLASVRP